jgi:hypothetical protein
MDGLTGLAGLEPCVFPGNPRYAILSTLHPESQEEKVTLWRRLPCDRTRLRTWLAGVARQGEGASAGGVVLNPASAAMALDHLLGEGEPHAPPARTAVRNTVSEAVVQGSWPFTGIEREPDHAPHYTPWTTCLLSCRHERRPRCTRSFRRRPAETTYREQPPSLGLPWPLCDR